MAHSTAQATSEYTITARTTVAEVRAAVAGGAVPIWRNAEYGFEWYEDGRPYEGIGVVVYQFGPDGRSRWSGSTSTERDGSGRALDVMREARHSSRLREG